MVKFYPLGLAGQLLAIRPQVLGLFFFVEKAGPSGPFREQRNRVCTIKWRIQKSDYLSGPASQGTNEVSPNRHAVIIESSIEQHCPARCGFRGPFPKILPKMSYLSVWNMVWGLFLGIKKLLYVASSSPLVHIYKQRWTQGNSSFCCYGLSYCNPQEINIKLSNPELQPSSCGFIKLEKLITSLETKLSMLGVPY